MSTARRILGVLIVGAVALAVGWASAASVSDSPPSRIESIELGPIPTTTAPPDPSVAPTPTAAPPSPTSVPGPIVVPPTVPLPGDDRGGDDNDDDDGDDDDGDVDDDDDRDGVDGDDD